MVLKNFPRFCMKKANSNVIELPVPGIIDGEKLSLYNRSQDDGLYHGYATHSPRATIRPSRPVNVALDNGRTKKFFFTIDLFSYLYRL